MNSSNILMSKLTPKSLYKYLLRKCELLPNPELQKFYKHSVRQGFNQHSDETEPERVEQIIQRAVKDIDWVLKKVKSCTMSRLTGVENDLTLRSGSSVTQVVQQEWEVENRSSFYTGVSLIASKPFLLRNKWKASEVLSVTKVSEEVKQEAEIQMDEDKSELIELFSQPWRRTEPVPFEEGVYNIKRKYFHFEGLTTEVMEHWDFTQDKVSIKIDAHPYFNMRTPIEGGIHTIFHAEFGKNTDRLLMMIRIEVVVSELDRHARQLYIAVASDLTQKFNIIAKSTQVTYESPETIEGLPKSPNSLLDQEQYFTTYSSVKASINAYLRHVWLVQDVGTNPEKFITEDLCMASYLTCFWDKYSINADIEFLEFGAGNGLLSYLLTCSQFIEHMTRVKKITGVGFDLRKRGLWRRLTATNQNLLQVRCFRPDDKTNDEFFKGGRNTWYIGNHADELTPYTILMAAKYRANFIVVPCCPFKFNGKFQRTEGLTEEQRKRHFSVFLSYIVYLQNLAKSLKFNVKLEKIRLPSTRNIAIIGEIPPEEVGPDVLKDVCQKIEGEEKIRLGVFNDENLPEICSDQKNSFIPRAPIQRINNCTQIDKEMLGTMVKKCFLNILSDKNMVRNNCYQKDWNAGSKEGIPIKDLSELMNKEEKQALKSQGKGVQTLVKNHKFIFNFLKGRVTIRAPVAVLPEEEVPDNIRSKLCYFFKNHPEGCPLKEENCRNHHKEL